MIAALLSVLLASQAAPAAEPAWTGEGCARVLVRVDPPRHAEQDGPHAAGAPRKRVDERPADVRIEFARLLRESGIENSVPDLSSVQVIRHDAATGKPQPQSRYAFARGEFDVPFRWYDAAIPYDFPECEVNLATSGGKLLTISRPRAGYFYECAGDAHDGRLAFVHREDGQPALYAIYFDIAADGKLPDRPAARGFVGDGLNRCEPVGHSTTGLIHSRVDVADWNGDGPPDLIVGCSRGSIVWYPNVGQSADWKFTCSRLLATRDGQPIDIGYGAAPIVVDFDADGRQDILVGGERNRVVWYRNVGTRAAPALEYAGLVEADGRPLELPVAPVPEGPEIYTLDYYPVLAAADWDADGDLDLLAGGYVTGRIYLYENSAPVGGPMQLHFAGELAADGEPIDVGWAAAPAVADLDGDGDLDVVSGSMPMTAGGGDSTSSERFVFYFENVGTRSAPRLHAVPFPRRGEFPRAALATPRLVDFNGDGLIDIVASSGEEIYFFPNVGTRAKPEFRAHHEHLPGVWSNAPLPGSQFLDLDGDGHLDAVDGPLVYRNLGRGSPGLFASPISLLRPEQRIDHLSGIGDDWTFKRLYDLDGDSVLDLLDADHAGHIFWHRNRGTQAACDFDCRGVRLELVGGRPLVIGSERTGFEALQGARATYAANDFDGDGRPDLVTADNFGEVMYFRQTRAPGYAHPTFDPPQRIAKLRIRAVPTACDWNADGHPDIVVGSSSDDVAAILGTGDATRPFAEPKGIKLPPAPDGAGAPLVVTDYNADGDPDIILHTAYGYTCFYERSFIEHGYAVGEVVKLELKPPAQ
jgi:hypothetical protein